jgi:hypothetical protein
MTLAVLDVPGAALAATLCAVAALGVGGRGAVTELRPRLAWQRAVRRTGYQQWCLHCKRTTEHELRTGCTACGRR